MSKKSRKLIRSTPTEPVVEVEASAPEPVEERSFYFLADVEPVRVDERELHQEMQLAYVGSPLALENTRNNLLDMEDDE